MDFPQLHVCISIMNSVRVVRLCRIGITISGRVQWHKLWLL